MGLLHFSYNTSVSIKSRITGLHISTINYFSNVLYCGMDEDEAGEDDCTSSVVYYTSFASFADWDILLEGSCVLKYSTIKKRENLRIYLQ